MNSSQVTTPRSIGVVGAGIIGIAVAERLGQQYPDAQITVFEKEDRVAAHQTGHNSGVVHAGLYYKPGSLKAELCRRGRALLREYCQEHGIVYRQLGKLVVALNPNERVQLNEIERRACANQVPGLVRLDPAGVAEIEPHVTAAEALYSPETAVVDFVKVCESLADRVRERGGSVLLSCSVENVDETGDRVTVTAGGRSYRIDQLMVCAGLGSDRIATMVAGLGDARVVPFRGEYHCLAEPFAQQINGLIYPVPDPRYPFLGVHITRDVDDGVHVGPNAVLALALEGYRWRDVNLQDVWQIAAWPGMRKVARQHWRQGAGEVARSISKRLYAKQVARLLPGVTAADLTRAPAGVRAQAVGRDGSLVDDFVIEQHGRVLLVRNAPSPAATSSMAIAEYVVNALRGETPERKWSK